MAQAESMRYRAGAAYGAGPLATVEAFARRWQAAIFAALAFSVPLAVYVATAAPTLYTIDSPELTTAAWTLGIAHSPGYPFYTLAGYVFSHIVAVGDPAFRLNVFSGVCGAVSVALVYALARRVTECSRLVALSAALTLAFSYWFWRESLYAEVYALDVALVAGTLLLAHTWRENGDARALAGAGLLFGLAMANRTSSLAILPGMLLFVGAATVTGEQRPTLRAIAGMVAGAALGLAFYLYIPLNYRTEPQYVWMSWFGQAYARDLTHWDGFWYLVSSEGFDRYVFGVTGLEFLQNLGRQASWLTSSFLGVGVFLGAYGAWRHLRTDLASFLWFASIAGAYVVFFAGYDVADREFMVLPVYMVWAIWLAIGLSRVPSIVRFIAGEGDHVRKVSALAIAALPVVAFAITLPAANLSGEHRVRNESEQLFREAPPNSLLIGTWVEVSPLIYLQEVDGLRPDIHLQVNTLQSPFAARALVRPLGERPVFVGAALGRLIEEPYVLTPAVGTWQRVELEPGVLPDDAGGTAR